MIGKSNVLQGFTNNQAVRLQTVGPGDKRPVFSVDAQEVHDCNVIIGGDYGHTLNPLRRKENEIRVQQKIHCRTVYPCITVLD